MASRRRVRVEKRDGYRVIVGGPVPPQAAAITLGNTIVVRSASVQNQELMAHELVHVRQFGELGRVRFTLRYVGSYLRFRLKGYGHMAAYRRIPLEVEASWLSRLHLVSELEPAALHNPEVSNPPNRTQVRRLPRRQRRNVGAPKSNQVAESVRS